VFGLALLVTLVAPCLCLAEPFVRSAGDGHACCEATGEAMKAADPACCSCLAPGSGDTVFERSSNPGPAVPAVRAAADPEPSRYSQPAYRPSAPRAVSPPKTALRV
jgi:hypothetical protein